MQPAGSTFDNPTLVVVSVTRRQLTGNDVNEVPLTSFGIMLCDNCRDWRNTRRIAGKIGGAWDGVWNRDRRVEIWSLVERRKKQHVQEERERERERERRKKGGIIKRK
jgi:hypothetical protein